MRGITVATEVASNAMTVTAITSPATRAASWRAMPSRDAPRLLVIATLVL